MKIHIGIHAFFFIYQPIIEMNEQEESQASKKSPEISYCPNI